MSVKCLNREKSVSAMLFLPEIATYLIPYIFPYELVSYIVSFMQPQHYFLEEHKNGEITKDGKSSSTLVTYSYERYARTCKLEPKAGTTVKFSTSNTQGYFGFGISEELITKSIGLFMGLGSYQSQLDRFKLYYYCDGRTNNEVACSCNSAYEETNHFELLFNSDSTATLSINNVVQPAKYEIPKEFYIYFGLYNSGSKITLPVHND
jgi:hypothetical protein